MAEKEYFLYIEGKRIEVTEEVYREYYRGERRERYFMEDLKRGRTVTDPETKESRYVPGREDSYERLLEAGRDFPAPGESLEETLHPETKNGGDRRSGKTRSAKCTSDPARSFVEDTAEKLGVNPCTVRRQIQTAKNLSPETKEIIRGADAKLSKKSALKLSRLEPEQQKEAATLLASREIRSVDEYAAKEKEAPEEISAQETSCGLTASILSGMALFVKTYETEMSDRTFAMKLSQVDPDEINRRGRADFSTNSVALRYARVILEKYNGQRGGRKLPYRFKG